MARVKHCVHCCKKIVGRNSPKAIYCSKQCGIKNRNECRVQQRLKNQKIRFCALCSEKIIGRIAHAIYCSDKCNDRASKIRNRDKTNAKARDRWARDPEKYREQSRVYRARNLKTMRALQNARYRKLHPLLDHACVVCNKIITGKNQRVKVCSKGCKQQRLNQIAREKRAADPIRQEQHNAERRTAYGVGLALLRGFLPNKKPLQPDRQEDREYHKNWRAKTPDRVRVYQQRAEKVRKPRSKHQKEKQKKRQVNEYHFVRAFLKQRKALGLESNLKKIIKQAETKAALKGNHAKES